MVSARSMPQIDGWRDARESIEVVDQVRLIEIAVQRGDVGPHDVAVVFKGRQYSLEPCNALIQLRRQAHFASKQLDESPLADSHAAD